MNELLVAIGTLFLVCLLIAAVIFIFVEILGVPWWVPFVILAIWAALFHDH
jgi:hypothetical protein